MRAQLPRNHLPYLSTFKGKIGTPVIYISFTQGKLICGAVSGCNQRECMYEDLRCGDCIAICKFVTAHILYANAMTGYIFLTTLDKYEVCSDQTTEKKQLGSTFEDAAKHQNSASSESRGCWAVALLVTDLTDAHNRQTGQDRSLGHACRTCPKPELSNSEMLSQLQGITDHRTAPEPTVLLGENLAIIRGTSIIKSNKRE